MPDKVLSPPRTSNPVCLTKRGPLTHPAARRMKFRCRLPRKNLELLRISPVHLTPRAIGSRDFWSDGESKHQPQDLLGYKKSRVSVGCYTSLSTRSRRTLAEGKDVSPTNMSLCVRASLFFREMTTRGNRIIPELRGHISDFREIDLSSPLRGAATRRSFDRAAGGGG